jgi:hypothetical protein
MFIRRLWYEKCGVLTGASVISGSRKLPTCDVFEGFAVGTKDIRFGARPGGVARRWRETSLLWLWYGVAVTLIGWRVSRRFGWRGFIGFIGFLAVYGPLRDYVGVTLTRGTVQVIVRTPIEAPQANGIAERFVRTARSESWIGCRS